MLLTSENPQLILYSSHASAHASVLAVGGLQSSECRVLAIPNDPTQLGEKVPNRGLGGTFAGEIHELNRILGTRGNFDQ
jgi:hypothetical protein